MLPGKTLSVADILQAVRRRAWLIAVPPVVMFFMALVYSSTVPNVYQSDMLIAIDPQRVPDAFVRSTVTLATDLRVEAISVQVLSRTALQEMIETLDLYPEERQTMPPDDVIAMMRENIQIKMERPRPQWGQPATPSAFHVLFTYREPQTAAKVTQQIGSRFVEQNLKDRGSLAGATNRFLESQLQEARANLEQQERRLEAFRQKHGPELPTQMESNMQGQLNAQMQAQNLAESLARDRDRRQVLDRQLRDAIDAPASQPAPVTPSVQGGVRQDPASPGEGSAQVQLATARATLADLERRYRPEHPDVVRTRRLVAELETKAAAEAATAKNRRPTPGEPPNDLPPALEATRRENLRQLRVEIESLDRQIAFKEGEERRVRTEIGEYQRRLEAVPGLESEWTALTRDYDTGQSNYKDLLQKSSAAQVALNLEEQEIGERFRIVDQAAVPVHPLPAVRGRINAAGLALGLMIGLGFAALLELRDQSFRSDSDVLQVLALPVLATVPRIETTAEKVRNRRRRAALSLAGATCLVVAGYVTWTLKLWNSLI
jgi:polysaccharide chain length determinant protein (PEP-CTERM system associated)